MVPRVHGIAHAMRPLLLALPLMVLLGCAPTVPKPREVEPPESAFAEVPFQPPAARVEMVPEPLQKSWVWMDGSWHWRGGRWVWRWGGWVDPPAGVSYQPPVTRRQPDGTLLFAHAAWRDASGNHVHAPPILAPPQDEPSLDRGPAITCPPPQEALRSADTGSAGQKSCGDVDGGAPQP